MPPRPFPHAQSEPAAADDLIAFGSPIIGLVQSVRERRAPMTEYRVRVGSSRFETARQRIVDVFASPISDDLTVASPCCSRSAPWPTRSTGNW
jgi:nitrogen-specific signal transduction histidine kinase